MKLLFFLLLSLTASGQLRINADKFGVTESEIREVLEATLQVFPKTKLPPLLVTNDPSGPITLYEKTARDEIVIKLDVHGRYWAQMIYQFAHELTHVRAGFRPDGQENKWFEETLCETASLYALRKLSVTWRDHPRFDSYRNQLVDYAQKVIASREAVPLATLPEFYKKHEVTLRQSPKNRLLNGAMAVTLLPLFEMGPERWHSLTTLNRTPAKKGLTLPAYFLKWHQGSPKEQQEFVLLLANHFSTLP